MSRRLCLLFCVLAAQGVIAEPQSLGRLFYTPAERARLDKAQPESEPITALRYRGLVESSVGRRTVWADGQPMRFDAQGKASLPDRAVVGGAQDELLRGGHIVVHPQK